MHYQADGDGDASMLMLSMIVIVMVPEPVVVMVVVGAACSRLTRLHVGLRACAAALAAARVTYRLCPMLSLGLTYACIPLW